MKHIDVTSASCLNESQELKHNSVVHMKYYTDVNVNSMSITTLPPPPT